MKKLIIGLFACLCFTSCINLAEKSDTLIVKGCTNTDVREGVTTYEIGAFTSDVHRDVIRYRTKIGTFEIGDTVVIVKK